jgi:hypothetical protein
VTELKMFTPCALAGAAALGVLSLASPPASATIWTDWSSATPSTRGTPGSATGTLNGVAVRYTGDVLNTSVTNGTATNWAPNSSFVGGTVTSSPSTLGDIIDLNGFNFSGPNTVAFASPIVNPILALWSLGSFASLASFTFVQTPTFEAGGPNSQYGGGPITVSGNVVSGREGNGVVQFTGTFSSISWTDTFENFYGFTVGAAGTGIPEPVSMSLLGVGVAGLGFIRRRGGPASSHP